MYDKYLVKEYDNLDLIAKKFNTSKDTILDINNIAYEDMIRDNMEIIVPTNKEEYYTIYTVNQGDSLYGIARRYNINPSLLSALNGIKESDYIYPKQEILIPKSNYSYYITKEGDTLGLVSDNFGSDVMDIVKSNTIYLLPGQLIVRKK